MFEDILNKCNAEQLMFLSDRLNEIKSVEELQEIIKQIDKKYDDKYGFKY
jgi:hypothetical protein